VFALALSIRNTRLLAGDPQDIQALCHHWTLSKGERLCIENSRSKPDRIDSQTKIWPTLSEARIGQAVPSTIINWRLIEELWMGRSFTWTFEG